MRGVKCRAYLEPISYLRSVGKKGYWHVSIFGLHNDFNGWVQKTRWFLFTGLPDKNGKEICDGDILGEWIVVDGEKIQSRQRVFWNEQTASFEVDESFLQDKSCYSKLHHVLDESEKEVIGNIYENPELLTK